MASIYLAGWRGTGTKKDPYRPDVDPAGSWSCIDLRPDQTVPDGYCLVANNDGSEVTGKQVFGLGRLSRRDGLNDGLGLVGRRVLENRLGVDLTLRPMVKDILFAILFEGARTDGTRWRPIDPAGRWYEVWLGGELVDAIPNVAGGMVGIENFDGANGSAIGNLQTWTEVSGNAQRVSNQVRPTSTGSVDGCRCELDIGSSNMYGKVTVATLTAGAGFNYVAVRCRYAAAADTHYHFEVGFAGATNDTALYSWTAGASTVIAGDTVTAHMARPFPIMVSAVGSSIKAWKNTTLAGTPFFSATNTAVTSGTRGGIMVYNDDASTVAADNFEVGTMGGGIPFAHRRAARQALLAR